MSGAVYEYLKVVVQFLSRPVFLEASWVFGSAAFDSVGPPPLNQVLGDC